MAYVGKAPQTGAYQILDDISSSFTGSTPGPFNLTVNGTAVSPGNEANCIISISGVVKSRNPHLQYREVRLLSHQILLHQILFFGTVLGDVFDIGTPTDSTVTQVL